MFEWKERYSQISIGRQLRADSLKSELRSY